ncbi:MAG: NAD(P)H-dependent oxidoreductase subunit E, partial [Phycisphaerae bacterium]
MSWRVIDRTTVSEDKLGLALSEAVEEKIRSFFPRYPLKRAALLPALHIAQDAIGYVSLQAMRDIAELLEIPPSAVM